MAWLHSPSSVTGISLCFKIIQSSSTEFMETKILAPTVSPSVEHLNYDTRSFLICLGEVLGTVLMAQDYRVERLPLETRAAGTEV